MSISKKIIKISSAYWGSSHFPLISMYDKQIISIKSLTCLDFFHQRFGGCFFFLAKHRKFHSLEQEPEFVKRYYLFCCLESGIRYENYWSLKNTFFQTKVLRHTKNLTRKGMTNEEHLYPPHIHLDKQWNNVNVSIKNMNKIAGF